MSTKSPKSYLKQKQITLTTNECYILSMWLQHAKDRAVDGKVYDFVSQHRENDIQKRKSHLYKVTFRLVKDR